MKNLSKPSQLLRIAHDEASQAAALPADHGQLFHGGGGRESSSMMSTAIPELYTWYVTPTPADTRIELVFTSSMEAGSGSIYITDGAVQTVIDRTTGQPTMRVVGATDTRVIPLGDLEFNGYEVVINAPPLKPGHAYAVYISPGALKSETGQVFAGLRTDRVSFETESAETTGPTMVAIDLSHSLLQVGRDIQVTMTFSEQVQEPALAAFDTPNAQFGMFFHDDEMVRFYTPDDGITWIGILRPLPGVAVTGNGLAIDMTQIRNLAGNAGTGSPDPVTYSVDSIVSAAVGPVIELLTDHGVSDMDGVTRAGTHEISGTIEGSMSDDLDLELIINDIVVTEGITTTQVTATSYTWKYEDELPIGPVSVKARVVDESGHGSAQMELAIEVDGDEPTIEDGVFHGVEFDASDDLAMAFDQQMYWTTGEANDKLVIMDAEGIVLREIDFDSVTMSWNGEVTTLVIPADAHLLAPGKQYRIDLPATLTDLAGNQVPVEGSLILHTAAVEDTTPPATLLAPALFAASNTGSMEDLITADNTPTFTGAGAEIGAIVELYEGSTLVDWVESTDGSWAITATAALADGTHTFTVKHKDAAGNYSGHSDPVTVTIDTDEPAAPPPPVLDAGSDTGVAGDHLTKDATPTFSGTGATAGDTMTLYANESTFLGTGVVDGDGTWSITVAEADALDDGSYEITVTQSDRAGNESLHSDPFDLVIDTTAPEITIGPGTVAVGGAFRLAFNELMHIRPDFSVKIWALGNDIAPVHVLLPINWDIGVDDGKEYSYVEGVFAIGSYKVTFSHTPTDLAGVELVGSATFNVDVPAT